MGKDNVKPEVIHSKKVVALSRAKRFSIFILLFIVQGVINVSSGLLSSASKDIKSSMNLNDKEYGMFGTANGIGRILCSVVYLSMVNSFRRKWILVGSLLIKGLLLFSFCSTNNLWLMIGIRGLIGFQHNLLMIYIPVWIDQFGIQKLKTFFMAMMQVIVPIGKVTGYLFYIVFGSEKWKYGFVIEGIILHSVMIIIFFYSEMYFLKTLVVIKDREALIEKSSERSDVSLFETRELPKKAGQSTALNQIKEVFSSPVFICCLFIKAVVFGVATVLHYWIGDYMRTVLLVDNAKVFGSYTVIAIVGPMGGLIISSITTYFIGEYENKHSSLTLIMAQVLVCICGLISPFLHSIYYYCITITLFLVFNSVVYPLIQGITITSVQPENKSAAFTISNFTTMLLTSGPFPFLYGAINDHFKEQYPWMAMFTTMLITSLGLIPMIVMTIIRYKTLSISEKKEVFIEAKVHAKDSAGGDDV